MAKHGFLIESSPIVLGCDFAGVVEEVGEGVEGFAVGDNVFGLTQLGQPGRGTWAEYVVADADLVFHTPASLTAEQAATMPVSLMTAAISLFHPEHGLGLKVSGISDATSVLVWGGATSVGVSAIQLLRRAGYKVVATASDANHGYLERIGAHVVADYHDDDVLRKVKSVSVGPYKAALDAVGPETARICTKALCRKCGTVHLAVLAGAPEVVPDMIKVHEVDLSQMPYDAELREWTSRFVRELLPDIGAGSFQPNRVRRVLGFSGLLAGVKRAAAAGGVRASKLVAAIGNVDAHPAGSHTPDANVCTDSGSDSGDSVCFAPTE